MRFCKYRYELKLMVRKGNESGLELSLGTGAGVRLKTAIWSCFLPFAAGEGAEGDGVGAGAGGEQKSSSKNSSVVLAGKVITLFHCERVTDQGGGGNVKNLFKLRLQQIGYLPWILDYPEINRSTKTVFDEIIPMRPKLQPDRLEIDRYSIEDGTLHKGLQLCPETGTISGILV